MEKVTKILVVDDDPDIRDMLKDYLSEHAFEIHEAENASTMRAFLERDLPDLILLDINLPGEDGLSLARFVREKHNIGIIMVSAANQTLDRIIGLEIGADDYVTKPFDPRELLARLKSVLRRYSQDASRTSVTESGNSLVPFGQCTINLAARQLLDGKGNEVPVTSMEFDLIEVFLENPNKALSRDALLNRTRNRDWDPYDRSIDIRVARLRKKIEADPNKPRTIKTIRGSGYMYIPGKE